MSPEHDAQLCASYPKMFAERNDKQSCMSRGFEHGDGWFALVDMLCACVQSYLDRHPDVPQVVVKQVKEKFGGLRFYYDGGDAFVANEVQHAEGMSFSVCEECGAVTEVGQTKGWIRTLCWKCVQDQRAHEKDKRQREILASWKANAFAKPVWLEMKEEACRKRKTP